jgi:hypothetical protein
MIEVYDGARVLKMSHMICTRLFEEESKNGSSSVVPGPSEVNRRTQAFRRGPGTVPLIAVYCDETAAAEGLLTARHGRREEYSKVVKTIVKYRKDLK